MKNFINSLFICFVIATCSLLTSCNIEELISEQQANTAKVSADYSVETLPKPLQPKKE